MKSPSTSDLKVTVVSDPVGFDALESEWDALHADSTATVFQSYAWLRTWWRHFGEPFPARELHLIVIRQNEVLVGVGPFFIQSEKISSIASTREFKFLGDGLSDYLDLILLPGSESGLLSAVSAHIGELWKSLDSIKLSEIPDESLTRKLLGDGLAAVGIGVSVEECELCPRAELSGTWPDTLAKLSGDQRRQLLKRCRQLGEMQPFEYECLENPEMLDAAMTDFITMHQERMEESGRVGAFSHDRVEGFHREVCGEFHQRGWLFLSFLKFSDDRVAATCSYLHKGRVYFHMSGVGAVGDAWKYSPGVVLHRLCMEESIQRGANTYDFLRGTEDYKYRLGAKDSQSWRITASRVRMSVKVLGEVGSRLGGVRRMMRSCLGAGGETPVGTVPD